jgi:ubiquinone/menaquinone biosynthesis C-methylase UbiE
MNFRHAMLIIITIVGSTGATAQETITKQTSNDHTRSNQGQEASVKPGINDPFLDTNLDVDEWISRFEVESREIFQSRQAILKALALKKGMRVADIGTGTGPFVRPFSMEVGDEGWVYALDIAPRFIERIAKLTEQYRLTNVTPILAGEADIRLAPNSIDVAFICDVYHHFEYPQASLKSISKALAVNGKLVLIDFERIEGVSNDWTMNHVRAGKSVFRAEIEQAGFTFKEEVQVDGFKDNYFLVFLKSNEGKK